MADQPIINRVLLKYGAMIDTLMTKETYARYLTLGPDEEILIEGVFGEKIYTFVKYLLGFIDNSTKDMGKVMEATANARRVMGEMPGGSRLAMR